VEVVGLVVEENHPSSNGLRENGEEEEEEEVTIHPRKESGEEEQVISCHKKPGHECLTGCASTYHRAMQQRRASRLKKSLVQNGRRGSTGGMTSLGGLVFPGQGVGNFIESMEQRTLEGKLIPKQFDKDRRRSVCAKISRSHERDKIIGTYKQISTNYYDEFLRKTGTGPLSLNMVMRATVRLMISQDPDDHWRIIWETAIKAKSFNGYATFNTKITQNRLLEGQPKPELLDDWDQRLVVSTLEVVPHGLGTKLIVHQVAEKDQRFHLDSEVTYRLCPEDPDILTVTSTIEDVVATRRFRRILEGKDVNNTRRHSVV